MIAKRFLREQLFDCAEHPRPWSDPRFFAAAPTRDQAKRIWWEDLKRMVPAYMLDGDPSESGLCIRAKWGAELHVVGLDKPQRIEGTPWDGGVVDEYADCSKPDMFDAHIRPALADRKGWCWLLGVPDRDAPGQIAYKRMYERARDGRDEDWGAYHWPSADILPADEIAAMKRSMDPELYRQEIEGQFVLAGGLAFPTFDYKTHVKPLAYEPALPICWALDFNVNPMCSGIIQHNKGNVRVLHEIILHDTDTNIACEAFLEVCEERGYDLRGLKVYGDPTGSARDSTSGTSDWAIVQKRLKNHGPAIRVPRHPWAVKDTMNAVRARLRTADGFSHLTIDPSCKKLIDDFESLLWPSDLSEGHCAAWLRYFCAWEYPNDAGMFDDMMNARVGSAA